MVLYQCKALYSTYWSKIGFSVLFTISLNSCIFVLIKKYDAVYFFENDKNIHKSTQAARNRSINQLLPMLRKATIGNKNNNHEKKHF